MVEVAATNPSNEITFSHKSEKRLNHVHTYGALVTHLITRSFVAVEEEDRVTCPGSRKGKREKMTTAADAMLITTRSMSVVFSIAPSHGCQMSIPSQLYCTVHVVGLSPLSMCVREMSLYRSGWKENPNLCFLSLDDSLSLLSSLLFSRCCRAAPQMHLFFGTLSPTSLKSRECLSLSQRCQGCAKEKERRKKEGKGRTFWRVCE